MIAVICAMPEERDALLKRLSGVKVRKGKKLYYHNTDEGNTRVLDNEYYIGKLHEKDVVISRCGVGEIYATMSTMLLIDHFKPELVINLGCAGSLNEDVHVKDIVVADRVAEWRVDVPGWDRSVNSSNISYYCDHKVIKIIDKLKKKDGIKVGPIVSADEFIYKKSQLRIIKKYFPEALCGEMEGVAVTAVCNANNIPVSIIRSISDETLISGSYKDFDLNLLQVCEKAADLAEIIIKRY